jgi:uncharacterized membrane protein YidH (DUF202 family)
MSTDPTAPIAAEPGGIWLQRAVGLVATGAGLAIGWLFVFTAYKISLREGEIETFLIGVLVVLAALTTFLMSSGLRMLLNRPNRYGSVFSPATWYIAATVFLAGGAFLTYKVLASGAPSVTLKPVLYAFFFGILCAWAGWLSSRKARRLSRNAA